MSHPATLRLSRLAMLEPHAVSALESAATACRLVRAKRELVGEGQEIAEPKLLVRGWAARARLLADGRRQFLGFILPGDLIDHYRHARPLSVCAVVAITDVSLCAAPPAATSPGLAEAYAVAHALDEAYLLSHLTRLGRLNAQERIGDLFLELRERLQLAGLVTGSDFDLPLTQEVLADALGLTSVHINRMLQLMRREGEIGLCGGRLTIGDSVGLARKVGRSPVAVSALHRAPDPMRLPAYGLV